MNSSTRTTVTSAFLLTLCACGAERPPAPLSSYYPAMPPSAMANGSANGSAYGTGSGTHHASTWARHASFDDVDAYKVNVAEHVMRYNRAHTFSGDLPPMLPAIVVLRITVDRSGRLTDVWVQRSRDEEASSVALASIQRSGPLPRPVNLLAGGENSFTFSETFLFNADYRFQLRSLASPQVP